MISVKICGITSPADAQMCVQAGARALGVVFYGLSERAISPAQARECFQGLPAGVKKVGVFVNMKKEAVADTAERVGLDMVQLSGDELVVDCQWLTQKGLKVVKAIRPKTLRDVHKLADYKDHVTAFNIDAFREGQFGGTGQVADWAMAKAAKQHGKPIILAGGLTGGNVLAALRAVEPSALDVCSGVEREPGRKDPKKVKGFFEAIRQWDDEVRAKGGPPSAGESGRLAASGGVPFRSDPPKAGTSGAGLPRVAEPPAAAPSPPRPAPARPGAPPPPPPPAPPQRPAAPPRAAVVLPSPAEVEKRKADEAAAKAPEASSADLVDVVSGPDPNESGAFLRDASLADAEDAPLSDFANRSAWNTPNPITPPPGGEKK